MGRSMASKVKTCSKSNEKLISITHGNKDKPNCDEHTVLHDITDDAELVKVSSTALRTKGFLECDLQKLACIS